MAGEIGFGRELQALRRSERWRGAVGPAGRGRGVVVANGYGAPPSTVAPVVGWLRRCGWDAGLARLGWNTDCGEAAAAVVEHAVVEAAERTGGPVALVGHSRGGLLARVVAVRRPDVVDRLVTLATPWMVGVPEGRGPQTGAALVRAARRRGLRVLASVDCGTGECCERLRADVLELPAVPWTACWSSVDGIGGTLSRPPADGPATVVDLRTTHLGAALSVPAWDALEVALA